MSTFQLEIVTPEKTVFSGEVESLRAPGFEGEFGVLARHRAMLAALDIGRIQFRQTGNESRQVATSGGFAEVQGHEVTILAETAEFEEEIDLARAEAARERARERLSTRRATDVDEQRAEIALKRAVNRLRLLDSGG
jgi:F-type H+-transporting ATPase subunit epsilon